MRYAVQVATETEKTTYYPEKIDRMKITTQRRKIEIKIENITNPKGKRDNKRFNSGKEAIESKKSRNETHKRMRNFSQIAGSHASRGVCRTEIKEQKKSIRTSPLKENTREVKKSLVPDSRNIRLY